MIDSHCHLADTAFEPDLAAVVSRARRGGVTGALCIVDALDAGECARGADACANWPAVRLATGVHPHRASADGVTPESAAVRLREVLASSAMYRAVGEIGLDYHYDFAPADAQRRVFAAQLEAAADLGLPVVIHTREADRDTVDLLRAHGRGVGGVFHCFSGDVALARQALDLGFMVSFSGIVTFPKAAAVHEAARYVPASSLLSETDCPYLAPVPRRGARNEPSFVTYVVARLAELRGEDPVGLAALITENYQRLFRP
jgi:TatD DNase family protein